jgi:hypothetical protein
MSQDKKITDFYVYQYKNAKKHYTFCDVLGIGVWPAPFLNHWPHLFPLVNHYVLADLLGCVYALGHGLKAGYYPRHGFAHLHGHHVAVFLWHILYKLK